MKQKTLEISKKISIMTIIFVMSFMMLGLRSMVNAQESVQAQINNGVTNITLTDDVTENITIPAGMNVTLNLNNHSIRSESKVTLTNDGTLTINGEGKLYASNNYAIHNRGTMTINGGEFINETEINQKGPSLIVNGWPNPSQNTSKQDAVMTINGGTFKGGLNTIKNDDYGVMTIKGGKFYNENMNTAGAVAVINWNKLTIEAGEFNASVQTNATDGSDYERGQLTISNGTFNKDLFNFGELLEITGGTFNGRVSQQPKVNVNGITTISGGTFNGSVESFLSMEISGGTFNGVVGQYAYNGTQGELVVTGGSFENEDSNVTIPEGYQEYETSDGRTVVDKATTIKAESKLYIKVGNTAKLNLELSEEKAKQYLTTTSNDDKVASVKEEIVKGEKAGKTTVVSKAGETEATTEVLVYEIKEADSENAVEVLGTKAAEKYVDAVLNNTEKPKNVIDADDEKIKAAVEEAKPITVEFVTLFVEEETIKEEEPEDIDLIKKINPNVAGYYVVGIGMVAGEDFLGEITELEEPVQISMEMPEKLPELKEGYERTYSVIRIHNGEAKELEAKVENGYITFESDLFSVYAVTYRDAKAGKEEKGSTSNPKTGDKIMIMAAIFGIAAGAFIVTKKLEKSKKADNK